MHAGPLLNRGIALPSPLLVTTDFLPQSNIGSVHVPAQKANLRIG